MIVQAIAPLATLLKRYLVHVNNALPFLFSMCFNILYIGTNKAARAASIAVRNRCTLCYLHHTYTRPTRLDGAAFMTPLCGDTNASLMTLIMESFGGVTLG